MVTVWATTPEDYERIRTAALGYDEFADAADVTSVSPPLSVCSWREHNCSCSLHAPSGYTRPIEHPRSDGAF